MASAKMPTPTTLNGLRVLAFEKITTTRSGKGLGDSLGCARCNAKIKSDTAPWVHLINGGSVALHPEDEAKYMPDGGDLGGYPVGPECAKYFGDYLHAADPDEQPVGKPKHAAPKPRIQERHTLGTYKAETVFRVDMTATEYAMFEGLFKKEGPNRRKPAAPDLLEAAKLGLAALEKHMLYGTSPNGKDFLHPQEVKALRAAIAATEVK